jgi:hypothetical protein
MYLYIYTHTHTHTQAMAAFSYSVGSMFKDLVHTLFLILVLLMAFGSALSIQEEEPFNSGFDVTIVRLLQEVGSGCTKAIAAIRMLVELTLSPSSDSSKRCSP